MDGVNAQLQRDRRKQRREDVERGSGIEEAARDQQHEVDDDEEDDDDDDIEFVEFDGEEDKPN